MKKTFKILTIAIMAMVMICTSASIVFAETNTAGIVDGIDKNITADPTAASDLTTIAGKVIGLVQIASAVAAVILIAVFGFKFILGSANEKADYQKSFIPLIVGVVVVFAATSIAKLLFGLIGK